jgi:MFS family permease
LIDIRPPISARSIRNERTLLPWYACHFAVVFCYSMISNAVYFLCIYRLKVPASSTLWIAAGGGFIYTLAAYFSGRLVDRWGAKRVLLGATGACLLVFLTGALAVYERSFALMAAVIFLLNLLATPSWPAIESALSRSPGTLRLGTRMMLYNLSWSSSTFIAFFLTGICGETLGWSNLCLVLGGIVLMVLLLMAVWTIPQSMMQAEHTADHSEDAAVPLEPTRAGTLLMMAWIANLFAYVSANAMVPLMPAVTKGLGINNTGVATAIGSIYMLSRVGGFVLAWLWIGWRYRIRWKLTFVTIMLVSTYFIIVSQNMTELILLQIVLGLALAMIYSGSLYYAMHLSKGSGHNAGIHEAVIGAGTVLGPALAAMSGQAGALGPKAMAILGVQIIGMTILLGLSYRLKVRLAGKKAEST